MPYTYTRTEAGGLIIHNGLIIRAILWYDYTLLNWEPERGVYVGSGNETSLSVIID